jgi:hypothetical protein
LQGRGGADLLAVVVVQAGQMEQARAARRAAGLLLAAR